MLLWSLRCTDFQGAHAQVIEDNNVNIVGCFIATHAQSRASIIIIVYDLVPRPLAGKDTKMNECMRFTSSQPHQG